MSERIDTASRILPASPAAVYAAFADPGAMERWIPPQGMTATMLHFDFRNGGAYRMRLLYDNAEGKPGKSSDNADDVEVRLLEVVPAERIEQAVEFTSDDPAFAGVMRMTWTFAPAGNGTRVTVRAQDVPRGIKPEDHVAGMTSTLDNLAAFLGGRRA